MRICDLHTHSVFSDGSMTPAELTAEAKRVGLSAIALTDHNTIAGLPEFMAAAEKTGIEISAAVEISTQFDIPGGRCQELHIVAQFVEPRFFDDVRKLLDEPLRRKMKSTGDMIARLNALGYDITMEDAAKDSANRNINRAHIAKALLRKGYVSSVAEAFSELLSPEKGIYVEPKRPDSLSVLGAIRSIGAVAVLAHPFLELDENELRMFLDAAVPAGLDAIEVYYSRFSAEQTELAAGIANEYCLLMSGGSDFHGAAKPDIFLGRGTGNLEVPYELYHKMKDLHERRMEVL